MLASNRLILRDTIVEKILKYKNFKQTKKSITGTCIYPVTKKDLEQFFYKIEILTLWESFIICYIMFECNISSHKYHKYIGDFSI